MNRITVLIEGMLVLAMGLLSLVDGIRLNKLRGEAILHYGVLGPGNYNFGIGLMLIIVGLSYLIISYPRRKLDGEKLLEKRELGKRTVVIMGFILGVYYFVMNIIGFLLATTIFLLLIHRTLGFRSWLINIGLSIAISVCFYIVFVRWLAMPLPRGLLFK